MISEKGVDDEAQERSTPRQPPSGGSNLKLARFDPRPCAFPKARVSPLPERIDLTSQWHWSSESPKAQVARRFRHFARGRYALEAACRLAGIGRGGALLAPAYHCVTMLDPAIALEADVRLYPLDSTLAPDMDRLDELLRGPGKPAKAILAAHFFGFVQDFGELRRWCDRRGVVLIEDCSHVLFSEYFQARGSGLAGHFVISSPYKFFPCADGGLLYSEDEGRIASVRTKSQGPMAELRGLKRNLERCWIRNVSRAKRSPDVKPLPTVVGETTRPAAETIERYGRPSSLFNASGIGVSSLHSSRYIARHSSIEENIRRRQSNYRRWAEAVSDLPDAHTPWPELPVDTVPYMFPLHIGRPDIFFYRLKYQGLPIWRWDDMAISDCRVAQDYRLHLLHLPCHQALSEDEIAWMVSTVQRTLSLPGATKA